MIQPILGEPCARCRRPMEYQAPEDEGEAGQWVCPECPTALVWDRVERRCRFVDTDSDEWLDEPEVLAG